MKSKHTLKSSLIIILVSFFAISCNHIPVLKNAQKNNFTGSTVAKFSNEDLKLIDDICRASFLLFWNEANPENGLIPDRKDADESSVAAVGFGLAALPIGAEYKYVEYEAAQNRALRTLKTLQASTAKRDGFFCHFIDMKTGNLATTGGYEDVASSIDTALLIAGALTAGEYFGGEVKAVADQLYAEVNWKAFLNKDKNQVYMAWDPAVAGKMQGEGKFDPATWDWYTDEALLISLLGISSPNPEYQLQADVFTSWQRNRGTYKGKEFIYTWPGTLFTYTFAHCFYDFKKMGKDTKGDDWFQNTIEAVKANRDWCRDNTKKYKTYGKDRWGITAGSGPGRIYIVPGHQPRGDTGNQANGGTLHPYGAAMSLPFLPEDSMSALHHMRHLKIEGKPLWIDPEEGGYGYMDGFNLAENWVSEDIIAIAQGPMLLLVENARSGLIWNSFMNHKNVRIGIKKTGFNQFK